VRAWEGGREGAGQRFTRRINSVRRACATLSLSLSLSRARLSRARINGHAISRYEFLSTNLRTQDECTRVRAIAQRRNSIDGPRASGRSCNFQETRLNLDNCLGRASAYFYAQGARGGGGAGSSAGICRSVTSAARRRHGSVSVTILVTRRFLRLAALARRAQLSRIF